MTARILIVGAGLVGRRHAALAANKGMLAGVVEPDPAARAEAAKLGAPVFADLAEGLATRPDGALLATPNQVHVRQGLTLVEARVPMLIEKPIADVSADALKLVQAAEAAGVPILVGHHRRHNPRIAAAKEVVALGRLGRINAVHAQFWLYKPDDYFAPAWRRAEGAGPLFINLIHDLDLLRHLCGEVAEVTAVESRAARGHEVEDTAAAILRFASGALGTVTVSDAISAPWSWEFSAGENPAYPHVPGGAYRIGGEAGSLSVPDLKLWRHPGERSWWAPIEAEQIEAEDADPLSAQLDHFAAVAAQGAEPLVSGREGLATLRLLEAIKRAARTGERQTVETG